MTTPQPTPQPTPHQQAGPRRTREQTAWWTVLTVLVVSVVLMLGLWD